MTFEIPEEMEWATYDASRVWQISKGGGHNFTAEVTAVGDNGSYDYDSMIFYVSEKVDKNEFHNASNYIKGTAEIYQDHLRENIKLDKKAISTLQKNKSEEKSIERIKKGIAEMEAKIPLAKIDHFFHFAGVVVLLRIQALAVAGHAMLVNDGETEVSFTSCLDQAVERRKCGG